MFLWYYWLYSVYISGAALIVQSDMENSVKRGNIDFSST